VYIPRSATGIPKSITTAARPVSPSILVLLRASSLPDQKYATDVKKVPQSGQIPEFQDSKD
jgi:hypothetical protein